MEPASRSAPGETERLSGKICPLPRSCEDISPEMSKWPAGTGNRGRAPLLVTEKCESNHGKVPPPARHNGYNQNHRTQVSTRVGASLGVLLLGMKSGDPTAESSLVFSGKAPCRVTLCPSDSPWACGRRKREFRDVRPPCSGSVAHKR